MSQSIDVAYVAELARIELREDELAAFQGQLETIVRYVEKIDELDLEGIEPTMHGQVSANVFRPDEPRSSLNREDVLGNAPARTETEFKLPRIVEEA